MLFVLNREETAFEFLGMVTKIEELLEDCDEVSYRGDHSYPYSIIWDTEEENYYYRLVCPD